MDQPQQPTSLNADGLIAWVLGAIATLGAIVVRGRFRVHAMREKVEAESRPRMDVEFLKGSREITEEWKEEVVALRAQVDKVREDYERRLTVWMDRAMSAEKQIPRLEAEILMLKSRVADLEKQITGGSPVASPPG